MAENPLLPNAELRALHVLLKKAVKAETGAMRKAEKADPKPRSRNQPIRNREALLAGTILQLRPGDILVAEPGQPVSPALLPEAADENAPVAAPALPGGSPHIMLAAGMGAAAKASGAERIVLAIARAGAAEADWAEALRWAQQDQLPLILAIADPSGPGALRRSPRVQGPVMDWTSVQKATVRLQFPVLSVDGEDAVAVYRVMQESVLRARSGGGPAILWAVLPSARELSSERPASASPLGRFQRYLRTRKIPL